MSLVSLGDYVLNGGEVAVLAIVEAVARLVPGVIGNAASLDEESHEDGLLEYPVYTKPAAWRGREVPVGAALRRPRRDRPVAARAAARPHRGPPARPPARRRPALGSRRAGAMVATRADAPELLVLQRACWVDEGRLAGSFEIPPLTEILDDVLASLAPGRPGSCARAGASSPPCAAGWRRTTPPRGRPGGSWSRPTSPGGASAGPCWRTPRRPPRTGVQRLWLNTGRRLRAQPAPLPQGGVPDRAGGRPVPRHRRPRQAPSWAWSDFVTRRPVWQNRRGCVRHQTRPCHRGK